VNFDGPVRVADTAGSGTATITLSFDNWKGAKVAPTTHSVVVAPARAGPKAEPVAENLFATLVHPDRKATVSSIKFSNDGKRLFVAGYPSGVVQFFDVATRSESRRIETPPGLRGGADYAYLSPDWKTLYVPIEKYEVKAIERDGKKTRQFHYSGRYRVWDVATGQEKASLIPEGGHAPILAALSPDGSLLLSMDRVDSNLELERYRLELVAWNLKTGARKKLMDGFAYGNFSTHGKSFVAASLDARTRASSLLLFDTATLKEVANLDGPSDGRSIAAYSFSGDGSSIALALGGKRGAPREVWFRDARTLEDRGRFVGPADPDRNGWCSGSFTPDGKSYIILGLDRKVVVWNVAAKKVARTFEIGNSGWDLSISPDSKTLAVAWKPKSDVELSRSRDPDPRDYPQPRITLFDLSGGKPSRTLILPHGFTTALAFSPDGKTLACGDQGSVRLFDLTR
jgi:WD40 repeat protein